MAERNILNLIKFEMKTDKLVEIKKTEDNGASIEAGGTARTLTIDYSPRKALILIGAYVGILNAHLPSEVIILLQTLLGGL